MAASGLIRRRALLLLVAFIIGLAGQAVVGAAMASEMAAPAAVSATATEMCPGCGGGDSHAPTMPQCMIAFCASMPAMPAQTDAFGERLARLDFVAAPYEIPCGVTAAPDPHPPRSFFHA